MKKLTSLLLAAALLVGSMGLLAAPAAAAEVAPEAGEGIVKLENFQMGQEFQASLQKTGFQADGFLLETAATKDGVVTIQVNPTAANLTYKVPVKAGDTLVSVDVDEMVTGKKIFPALLNKSNLSILVTADEGVTVTAMSYYVYAYLIDTTVAPATEVKPGDVDLDDTVEVTDALEALRAAVKLTTLEGDALKAADLDGNGEVTVADALGILRIAVGLDA